MSDSFCQSTSNRGRIIACCLASSTSSKDQRALGLAMRLVSCDGPCVIGLTSGAVAAGEPHAVLGVSR